ncbi:adhesion G protein-coupled receptor E3-like [Astyanax mexicanus]|uniref:Adhesion G protein-coupled receptor E3-like n=1 Tax=Astyanax mexicanus TaxID=7994 RepID=A0A8T2KT61_ASTMX|nr:adhesion G protein-coupled receptor E3-like [Astyanax mexicanus]
MSSLLSWITALLLSTLPNCVTDNACPNYTILQDPWRNVGFFSSEGVKTDTSLTKPGWYRFNGVGGNRIVEYCQNSTGFNSIFLWTDKKNSTKIRMYSCDAFFNESSVTCRQGNVFIQNCDGGLVLYYLHPGTLYATRHSSCSNSSCGKNAHCSMVRGGCHCDDGFSVPDGFQPSGESYGCTDFHVTQTPECQNAFTLDCVTDYLNQIQNSSTSKMSEEVVVFFLDNLLNRTSVLEGASTDQTKLASFGNSILNATETLVSVLVKKTNTSYYKNLTVESIEAAVFVIGTNDSLTEIPRMNTSNAFLDINLIEILKHSADAVMFLSYSNMSVFLKPSYFNSGDSSKKNNTMVSTVMTVKLLSTQNQQTPSSRSEGRPEFNITIEHTAEVKPKGTLICVNWMETEWVEGRCKLIRINSSFTTCFCVRPGTFALIMQIDGSSENSYLLEKLNKVAVPVGLVFLTLSLLTFIFCQTHSLMINTALINLCISLFLAHLIFLLTQIHLLDVASIPMLCAALAGVLHFLFLSAFVWMLIEAVLLFISVKNLTKLRSRQTELLSWRWLIIIGYIIPLVTVGVSVGLFSEGYGSEQCWLKRENGFLWSFLGPVCVILAINMLLFIMIGVLMISTLRKLNNQMLQVKVTTKDKRLVESVMVKTLLQFIIIGCFWTVGFFTESSEVVKILFMIVNSQQGTFIFLIHCVLNYEIRQQYKKLLFCFWPSSKSILETTNT